MGQVVPEQSLGGARVFCHLLFLAGLGNEAEKDIEWRLFFVYIRYLVA